MDDPGKGGQRKDLKENKTCHEVRRQHDTLRRPKRQDDEKPVPVKALPLMGKILF